MKRLYALWEDHCKRDVISIANIDTTNAQRTASDNSNRKPSATSPWQFDNNSALQAANVLKDKAIVLWAQLTSKLDAEGLVWMDLPGGDELIAILCEMGFSAIQRIRLRKMLCRRCVSL